MTMKCSSPHWLTPWASIHVISIKKCYSHCCSLHIQNIPNKPTFITVPRQSSFQISKELNKTVFHIHVYITKDWKNPLVYSSWQVYPLARRVNILKVIMYTSFIYHLFCRQHEYKFWDFSSPVTWQQRVTTESNLCQ